MGTSKSKPTSCKSVQEPKESPAQAQDKDQWEVIDGDNRPKSANRIAFDAHKAEGKFENLMQFGRYAIYNNGKYVMVTPFPEHTIAMNERLFAGGKPEYFYTADD